MRKPRLVPYWTRLWRALSMQIQVAVALFASWWTLDATPEEKTRLLAFMRLDDPMALVVVTALATIVSRAVRQASLEPPAGPAECQKEDSPTGGSK